MSHLLLASWLLDQPIYPLRHPHDRRTHASVARQDAVDRGFGDGFPNEGLDGRADFPDVHRRIPLGENGEHGRLHPAGASGPYALRSWLPPGVASLPYGRQLGSQPLEPITDLSVGEDAHQFRQDMGRLGHLVPVAPA